MTMQRSHNRTGRLLATVFVCSLAALCVNGYPADDEYDLHIAHRINAHGDEFMSLSLTSDGRRLVIGTEKGELIVWGIVERKILSQFHQGSPVHCVVALSEPRYIVAVGGPHSEDKQSGVARRWNIDTGTYEEWPGAGEL